MCTEQLPPGGYPTAVNKIYHIISIFTRVYIISDILNDEIKVSLVKILTICVMTHTCTTWGSASKNKCLRNSNVCKTRFSARLETFQSYADSQFTYGF
jgi:hypothetical protein